MKNKKEKQSCICGSFDHKNHPAKNLPGYTPGPLEITYEAETKTWGVCIPNAGDVIAQLIEKESDAKLYAAAPQLVETLKRIVFQLHDIEIDKTNAERLCQRYAEEALKSAGLED